MSGVGPNSINWGLKHVTTFPYMAGVCAILLSMLGLPLVAILVSGLAFLLLRTKILRDSNGFHRMLWVRCSLTVSCSPAVGRPALDALTWVSCGWPLHHAHQSCAQHPALSRAPSDATQDLLCCACCEGQPCVPVPAVMHDTVLCPQ